MNRSESITKLAVALASVQSVMENVVKESTNPYFKSKYADLASVCEAIKKPLYENGFAISQPMSSDERGEYVETILMHSSGEWISGRIRLENPKKDMQGMGSAITYARRYSLMAIVGLAPEDDDGNHSSAVSVDFISKEQVEILQSMIIEKSLDAIKLCKFLNVETLEKIPVSEYQKAVKAVEAAKGKNAIPSA